MDRSTRTVDQHCVAKPTSRKAVCSIIDLFLAHQRVELQLFPASYSQAPSKTNLIHVVAIVQTLHHIASEAILCHDIILLIECIHYRNDLSNCSRTAQAAFAYFGSFFIPLKHRLKYAQPSQCLPLFRKMSGRKQADLES